MRPDMSVSGPTLLRMSWISLIPIGLSIIGLHFGSGFVRRSRARHHWGQEAQLSYSFASATEDLAIRAAAQRRANRFADRYLRSHAVPAVTGVPTILVASASIMFLGNVVAFVLSISGASTIQICLVAAISIVCAPPLMWSYALGLMADSEQQVYRDMGFPEQFRRIRLSRRWFKPTTTALFRTRKWRRCCRVESYRRNLVIEPRRISGALPIDRVSVPALRAAAFGSAPR